MTRVKQTSYHTISGIAPRATVVVRRVVRNGAERQVVGIDRRSDASFERRQVHLRDTSVRKHVLCVPFEAVVRRVAGHGDSA
ncbi:hypothetical protein [Haloferax sp. DFSO60]|uniref:hypothetical protein n=1 Tax=Haloferax sp. DFSO60 TaxID=3388652 RepID=UPI00397D82FB